MAVDSQSPPPDESSSQPAEEQTPQTDTQSTKTEEANKPSWLGSDPVTQLREWAGEKIYPLPDADVRECIIGSEPSANIQLSDPRGLVSRRHARLFRTSDGIWRIQDTDSKNGVHLAGESLSEFRVTPGIEIGVGSLTLVAENRTLIQLRGYLARVLGWEAGQRPAIDLAIRAIRAATTLRAPISLDGTDDLVAVARQIHRHTTLAGAPFIVFGERPREKDGSLRVTATHDDPMASFEQAAGGTVCVRAERPPAGLGRLMKAAREPRRMRS